MVEHVGERSRQGGAETFRDTEALSEAYMLNVDAIAFEGIPAGVAEMPLLRHGERGRIETLGDSPVETGEGAGHGMGQSDGSVCAGGVRNPVTRGDGGAPGQGEDLPGRQPTKQVVI